MQAVVGTVFRFSVATWCLGRRGPLYVSMFKPLAVVVAVGLGVIFVGDALYLGSLVGALIIVTGFYAVMWGKAKEEKVSEDDGGEQSLESSTPNVPLLQNRIGEV
uniref:WAT1-related protein n=1 Tax=Davidia involucrata TaxID=16924 RepID=A0A5B7A3F5_DAVIN